MCNRFKFNLLVFGGPISLRQIRLLWFFPQKTGNFDRVFSKKKHWKESNEHAPWLANERQHRTQIRVTENCVTSLCYVLEFSFSFQQTTVICICRLSGINVFNVHSKCDMQHSSHLKVSCKTKSLYIFAYFFLRFSLVITFKRMRPINIFDWWKYTWDYFQDRWGLVPTETYLLGWHRSLQWISSWNPFNPCC